jgi:hypothetical protein
MVASCNLTSRPHQQSCQSSSPSSGHLQVVPARLLLPGMQQEEMWCTLKMYVPGNKAENMSMCKYILACICVSELGKQQEQACCTFSTFTPSGTAPLKAFQCTSTFCHAYVLLKCLQALVPFDSM